jgi:ABC-2 type transport system permease protein
MATILKTRPQPVVSPRPSSAWDGMVSGVFALWLKHMRKFMNSSMEIGATLAMPLLWMLLFGVCMSGAMQELNIQNISIGYQAYITPGVMLLTSLGAAGLGGATLLIERINGSIKEYLVAPIPRLAVLIGSLASGVTKATLQAVIVLIMGIILEGSVFHLNPLTLLGGIALVVVYSLGFVGLAAAIASKAKGMEGYHSFIMILNLPVLFLSNALYPLAAIPDIVKVLALLNPTTYAVDAIRALFYGATPEISLLVDIPVLLLFMVGGIWYGFRNFKQAVSEQD